MDRQLCHIEIESCKYLHRGRHRDSTPVSIPKHTHTPPTHTTYTQTYAGNTCNTLRQHEDANNMTVTKVNNIVNTLAHTHTPVMTKRRNGTKIKRKGKGSKTMTRNFFAEAEARKRWHKKRREPHHVSSRPLSLSFFLSRVIRDALRPSLFHQKLCLLGQHLQLQKCKMVRLYFLPSVAKWLPPICWVYVSLFTSYLFSFLLFSLLFFSFSLSLYFSAMILALAKLSSTSFSINRLCLSNKCQKPTRLGFSLLVFCSISARRR